MIPLYRSTRLSGYSLLQSHATVIGFLFFLGSSSEELRFLFFYILRQMGKRKALLYISFELRCNTTIIFCVG